MSIEFRSEQINFGKCLEAISSLGTLEINQPTIRKIYRFTDSVYTPQKKIIIIIITASSKYFYLIFQFFFLISEQLRGTP